MVKINSEHRPHSIRIYLTENCNANCPFCFNSMIRIPSHMDIERAYKLFKYLRRNNIRSLKMMGGEPTVHPQFENIYKVAQQNFRSVSLFTNAKNLKILKIEPREQDGIIYNYYFITPDFNPKKLLLNLIFFRIFEVVVDSKTDLKNLLKKIDWTYNLAKEFDIEKTIQFQITCNCMENIFKERVLLNNHFITVFKHIFAISPNMLSFDHILPRCFWTHLSIRKMKSMHLYYYDRTCRGSDMGLIDAGFNLRHCNQYPVKLMNIFDMKNQIVSIDRMYKALEMCNQEKLNSIRGKCENCEYFSSKCTGGCMMHKDFVFKSF